MKVKISIVLKSFEAPKSLFQWPINKKLGSLPQATTVAGDDFESRGGFFEPLDNSGAYNSTTRNLVNTDKNRCRPKMDRIAARVALRSSENTPPRNGVGHDLIFHWIRLPLKQSLYTVLRSPHIDKKSREQFEMKVHKQLIIIITDIKQLREKLFHLKYHEMTGAQMKIVFHYKTRLYSKV